jgi:hypothetical protein
VQRLSIGAEEPQQQSGAEKICERETVNFIPAYLIEPGAFEVYSRFLFLSLD